MDKVIEVLEKSIAKNGVQPLTTLHLLNILKLADKMEEQEQWKIKSKLDEARMQDYADQCGDRT